MEYGKNSESINLNACQSNQDQQQRTQHMFAPLSYPFILLIIAYISHLDLLDVSAIQINISGVEFAVSITLIFVTDRLLKHAKEANLIEFQTFSCAFASLWQIIKL